MTQSAWTDDLSIKSTALLLIGLIPAYPFSFCLSLVHYFFDFGLNLNPSLHFLWIYAFMGAVQLSSWNLLAESYSEAFTFSPGGRYEAAVLGLPLLLTIGVAGSRVLAAVTLDPLTFFVFFLFAPVFVSSFLVGYVKADIKNYFWYVGSLVLSLIGISVFWVRLLA